MSFEALLDAVRTGNLKAVKDLLEGSSVDVLPVQEKGSYSGRYSTIYQMINDQSRWGRLLRAVNPLIREAHPHFLDILVAAAWGGHIEVFKYLLGNTRVKEKINSATGQELIYIFCRMEDIRFLDELLAVPAFLEIAAKRGYESLKEHAFYNRLDFVKRLLEIPEVLAAEIENQTGYHLPSSPSALYLAIKAQSTPVIDHFLEHPAILARAITWDPCSVGLLETVQIGNLRVVQQLLNNAERYGRGNLALSLNISGIVSEEQDHSCLKAAIDKQHLDIVFVLLVTYKCNKHPFPALTDPIEGYTDLNDFYRRYKPSVAPQFDPIIGELRATPTWGSAPNIVFSLIARYAAPSINNTDGSSITITRSETTLAVPAPAKS